MPPNLFKFDLLQNTLLHQRKANNAKQNWHANMICTRKTRTYFFIFDVNLFFVVTARETPVKNDFSEPVHFLKIVRIVGQKKTT